MEKLYSVINFLLGRTCVCVWCMCGMAFDVDKNSDWYCGEFFLL